MLSAACAGCLVTLKRSTGGRSLLRYTRPPREYASKPVEAFLGVRCLVHQRLELPEIIGHADHLAQIFDVRLELAEHAYVLAVGVQKHLFIDAAVVNKRRCHFPVRSDHSIVGAAVVAAAKHLCDVIGTLRIEFGEIPLASPTEP